MFWLLLFMTVVFPWLLFVLFMLELMEAESVSPVLKSNADPLGPSREQDKMELSFRAHQGTGRSVLFLHQPPPQEGSDESHDCANAPRPRVIGSLRL